MYEAVYILQKESLLLVLENKKYQRQMTWKHVGCRNMFSHARSFYLKWLWWAVCSIVKSPILSLTSGKIPINSTRVCFHHTHSYTRSSAGLRIDLSSCESVKKLTSAYYLKDTHKRLNISNRIFLTKSCWYLNHGSFFQWIVCFLNVSKHALWKTGQTSSIGNKGTISRYLRKIWWSTGDICWSEPSIGIARRRT